MKHFFPICIAEKDDVGDAVRSSPSIELQQKLERKGQAATGISVDIGWLLKGSTDNNYVVKVNYSLTDVRVEEIALGANSEIYGKLMNQPQCSRMANQYLRAAGYVCQVASILSATAEFKLDRDSQSKLATSSSATVSEVKDIMKQAVEAQGNQDLVSKEGRLLAGKALQYGAVLNPMCMAPTTARFARVVPSRHSDVSGLHVLFNILEPMLPVKADKRSTARNCPPGCERDRLTGRATRGPLGSRARADQRCPGCRSRSSGPLAITQTARRRSRRASPGCRG